MRLGLGRALLTLVRANWVFVLEIERFGLEHTRGASHDHSRIIRLAQHQSEYAALAPHAYELLDPDELTARPSSVYYPEDVEEAGYDGAFEENMVVCLESYVGAVGGREGVKLEQPMLITRDGARQLCDYPFKEHFH